MANNRMAEEKNDICSALPSVVLLKLRITSVAGENEASVARRPVYSGACPACVNGSGTAHVRAYGDRKRCRSKGQERKAWGGGGGGEREAGWERWGRAGYTGYEGGRDQVGLKIHLYPE